MHCSARRLGLESNNCGVKISPAMGRVRAVRARHSFLRDAGVKCLIGSECLVDWIKSKKRRSRTMWNRTYSHISDQLPQVASKLLAEKGVTKVEWHGEPSKASRNTWLLRGCADRLELLVKLSRNSRGDKCAGEVSGYEMLHDKTDEHCPYAAPAVLASDEMLGLLIVEYVDGVSLDRLLIDGYKNAQLPGGHDVTSIATMMGQALGWFHEQFPSHGYVRLYCDYGPKNLILSRHGNQLYFIDPPSSEIYGDSAKDIGLTLFELTKLTLLCRNPGAIVFWPKLRRAFLEGYQRSRKSTFSRRELETIHRWERRRYVSVLKNYGQFFSFPDWGRQLLRAFAIIPLLLILRIFVLPAYQRLDRLIDDPARITSKEG